MKKSKKKKGGENQNIDLPREKKEVAFTAIHKVKMIIPLLDFGPLIDYWEREKTIEKIQKWKGKREWE